MCVIIYGHSCHGYIAEWRNARFKRKQQYQSRFVCVRVVRWSVCEGGEGGVCVRVVRVVRWSVCEDGVGEGGVGV